ncbi:hypothetical protein LJC73_05700 [Bacteroidales bacterium OttesenSCG-928-L14]|nr:hypothetical protein [Bacteroidales bacterium OttesenSCG-928-L14]
MKWLKSYPFWICVIFASILWFFLYLSNTVELKLKLKVVYSNLPENFVVAKTSSSIIPVSLFVRGNDVNKTKEAFDNFYVNVDLGFVQINDSIDVLNVSYSPASFAKSQIDAALKSNPNFNISIDSIFVMLEKSLTKMVPITDDYEYIVPKTYFVSSNSGPSVDSVKITGLVNVVKNVNEIYIGKRNLGIITTPKIYDINLSKLYPNIIIEPENIHYILDVHIATQGEVDVYLKDDYNRNVQFFPNFVNVKYSVSVGDYDKITADDFVITIDSVGSADNKAFVYLSEFPSSVNIISVKPDFVEYYFFEE